MTLHAFFHDPNAMITAEAVDGEEVARTISGTAVPWDVWGRVSDGSYVKFVKDSLDAGARPVVAAGHDSNRPIGRVSSNTSTDAGMSTTVKVSKVRDGDDALVLASDGVLGMFSVGVDPIEFSFEEHEGEMGMVVAKGEWQHLALLPFGAFEDALVTNVAASKGDTTMPESTGTVTTEAPPAPVEAALPVVPPPTSVPIIGASAPQSPLTIGRLAQILATANSGGLRAAQVQAQIEAALTNVTTTNVPSPPTYRTELVGLIDHGSPLPSRLDQRPLPESGMEILYPKWGAFPDSTALQATQKSQIGSGDVSWSWVSTPIGTWAQGNDLSLQAVQRSNPSAMDAYIRAAAVDAAKKWDIYCANQLLVGSIAAVAGATFLDTLKNLFAALVPANVPPGRVFVAMSYAEFLGLITVTGLNGPAYFDINIDLGTFLPDGPSGGGIDLFVDPYLPCKYLAGISNAAATYGGPPGTDIRVVDVSLLGVDVGVYFFGAVAPEYPAAFSHIP